MQTKKSRIKKQVLKIIDFLEKTTKKIRLNRSPLEELFVDKEEAEKLRSRQKAIGRISISNRELIPLLFWAAVGVRGSVDGSYSDVITQIIKKFRKETDLHDIGFPVSFMSVSKSEPRKRYANKIHYASKTQTKVAK